VTFVSIIWKHSLVVEWLTRSPLEKKYDGDRWRRMEFLGRGNNKLGEVSTLMKIFVKPISGKAQHVVLTYGHGNGP